MATKHHQVVKELIDLIAENKWEDKFNEALISAKSYNIAEMEDLHSMEDYYCWLDAQLYWVPIENYIGKLVYEHVCKFYFILDQPTVLPLQNKVAPTDEMQPLTPLSAWMVKYIKEFGAFMDTPESLTPESEKTFFDSPLYNMNEYLRPRGGWKTYNDLFGRSCKPGFRPVADITNSRIITSPADCTFGGQWEIREDSHITIKGFLWKVMELLEGSPYKDRFKGGYFTHSFLNTFDYHRQHAPVGGRVVEARNIQGTVYLEVNAEPIVEDEAGKHQIVARHAFDAPDNPGYEFIQTRGLIIIDSPMGLVAILPMGMAQVSSVVITAEEGRTLRKGEEISYFQFGGSDIVMLFEAASNVNFTAQPGVHYRYGTKMAEAYPVI
jgi:phosphatidylserine decarboxylase